MPKLPQNDTFVKYYDGIGYEWEQEKGRCLEDIRQWKTNKLAEILRDYNFESVLDIGCGSGITLEKLSYIKQISVEKRIGCDLSLRILTRAKSNYPNTTFVRADAQSLPFRDKQFDLAICTAVLEHLPDPEKALLEINRVSNYALIEVPLEDCLTLNIWRSLRKFIGRTQQEGGHVQFFSVKPLFSLLGSNGFRVLNSVIYRTPLRLKWGCEVTYRGKAYRALATAVGLLLPAPIACKLFAIYSIGLLSECRDL